MIGTHHIYNCLEAAAVGLAYGIELTTIVRGLESVDYVPGRLERDRVRPAVWRVYRLRPHPRRLDQRAGGPGPVTAGRLICVFGAGGERDCQKRPLMGRAVEQGADLAILTNDNPRHEDPLAIFRGVLDGFQGAGGRRGDWRPHGGDSSGVGRGPAGRLRADRRQRTRDYQIIGDRRLPLDDHEVAREWLYRQQSAEVVESAEWRVESEECRVESGE